MAGRICLLLVSTVMLQLHIAAAQEQTGAWVEGITVAPYGWLAGFDGTVGVPSADVDPGGGLMLPIRLDVSLDGELEEIGFMFYADWRAERWMAFFDSVWVNVSQGADVSISRFLPDSDVVATIDGNIYTMAAGYRLKDWRSSTLSAFAGPRYYDVEAIIDAQGGLLPQAVTYRNSTNWTDAIIGLRYAMRFGQNWSASVSLDAGAGSSTQSRQAMATMGYQLPWFSIVGGYRHLAVDYERGSLFMDIALSGPMIGLSMHF